MEQRRELFLPAEWHRQQMVQLTWPHENSDWAYMLKEVEDCFVEIAIAISKREKLLIVAPDPEAVRERLHLTAATIANIRFFQCESNDTWARDHAFITLLGDTVPHYLDFEFNGWGRKFAANLDNAINSKLYDSGVVIHQQQKRSPCSPIGTVQAQGIYRCNSVYLPLPSPF